ncbi:MAG: chlorophyll a/b-binding protein [Pseudanabaenaceae cyanobacterium]
MTEPNELPRSYTVNERGLLDNFALEPKMYIDEEGQRFGWTEYAEIVNGRLAMIGFVALLILELTTGKGLIGLFSLISGS